MPIKLGMVVTALSFSAFWGSQVALADNGPHQPNGVTNVTGDNCAACHRAHTAKGPSLLKGGPTMTDFCYTCHGGTGAATNVQNGGSTAGALRGGGFSFARIDGAHPTGQGANKAPGTSPAIGVLVTGVATTSAHTLDVGQKVWGNGAIGTTAAFASSALSCGSCHNPHGGANAGAATYRILRPIPVLDAGASLPATGVVVADETTKVYTTTNYWSVAASSGGFMAQSAAWCSTCHTRYNRSDTSATMDTTFTYGHDSNAQAGNQATCIQCHVAHGSNAATTNGTAANPGSGNVPWPDGTVANPAQNSRLLRIDNRGICLMCHLR